MSQIEGTTQVSALQSRPEPATAGRPKPYGATLQPHIDTIHLAAVELLRSDPDPQVVSAGERALETVIQLAGSSSRSHGIVEAARIAERAFKATCAAPGDNPLRVGHYVAAIVADLSRTVDALDRGDDPANHIEHAHSILDSILKTDQENLIEIDLNDRDQLARLLQSSYNGGGSEPEAEPETVDTRALRECFEEFARHADRLLQSAENPEMIEDLANSLADLLSRAAEARTEHVSRVVACALRVIESHRSAGEALPLDAVEFIVACRRIIPMILDSPDNLSNVSKAVDALVDQSAFVLLELRRGARPPGNLWPEPGSPEDQETAVEVQTVSPNGATESTTTVEGSAEETPMESPVENSPDWLRNDDQDASADAPAPVPEIREARENEPSLSVSVNQIEDLIHLTGELAIRSGGYSQRARKVLSVSQDINSIGDRLRNLIRGWNDGKYQNDQILHHFSEITADLGLAAADLEHARGDHIAASERQADARERLEQTISKLRSMPVKTLTDPLEVVVSELARGLERQVELKIEGASTVVDALHGDALAEALRQIVINAVEHGIEPPEVRQLAGKSPTGLIRVKATRDGSQTVIQVTDDGAGMDDSVILECAEAAGYPVPKRGMTRDRILQYVFLPGFTTKPAQPGAEFGLGLDHVSEAVTGASGSVMVHSDNGYGSVFTLRLPVAAMAMPASIVAISSERYAIPAAEIKVVDTDQMGKIDSRGEGYRVEIEGETFPAADLGALLGVRSHHHVQSDHGAFLQVGYDGDTWVLRVDRVLETESITVQPIGREYQHIYGVVGSAVLSSGEHAPVLDIAQVLDSSSRRGRRFSRQTASLSRVPFALVSDDSISVRRELAAHLEQGGWRVVEARDAFEARELLESIVPDLIVVDLDLPAHGGFQISQAARSLNDTLVIGLTTRDDPEVRHRAETLNIDAYLVKPLDLDSFSEALGRVMRGHEATDESDFELS